MLFEFLTHLAALDFQWMVSLAANNLMWAFMFGAFSHFINEGRKFPLTFAVVVADTWAIADFASAGSIVVFSGGMLLLYYLSKFALVAFVESSPSLHKKLMPLFLLQGWVAIIAYNLLG